MQKIINVILIMIGSISVIIGVIGIVLPILPTTPFLILGGACYLKGSKRLYVWLTTNKYLGHYIKNYIEKKGIPLKTKVYAISLLWVSIMYTTVFIVELTLLKVMLIIIAILVSWHIIAQNTIRTKKI